MAGASQRGWLQSAQAVCAVMALFCVAAALLPGLRAEASQDAQTADFVRVRGAKFWLSDKPFRFVGANASIMHGASERGSYERVLDAVAADGLKVIRIWALGEVPRPGKPYHPAYAFRIGEDGWVEESFVHLDRVLAAAKKRELRVIVVLANRWKDYGGIGTYLTWAGQAAEPDESGEPPRTSLATFYESARCQTLYREHVARVVGRTKSITQLAYRDDPTIMAWELINEASAVTAREEEGLLSWVRENARFVRSLDPNHLISAGHIGYSTSRERSVWGAVQSLPEVDFADAHAYPLGDPRISNTAQLSHFMDDPLALAQRVLKKPLVFGEFGFASKSPRGAHAERVRWMQAFLGHAAAGNAAGALVWIYEPPESPRRKHSINVDPGDRGARQIRRTLSAASSLFHAPEGSGIRGGNLAEFVKLQSVRSSHPVHRAFVPQQGGHGLDIDPTRFALSRFERTGVYEGGPLDHVWGVGEGFVEYRFVAPEGIPRAVVVEARVSSELPGFGDGKDPRDGSDVEISLDGELLATVRAVPDDALGAVVRAELRDARALRKTFLRSRSHRLRFRALPSRYVGGLCIYGRTEPRTVEGQASPPL